MWPQNTFIFLKIKKIRGQETLLYGQVEAGRKQKETLAIARAWELRYMFYSEEKNNLSPVKPEVGAAGKDSGRKPVTGSSEVRFGESCPFARRRQWHPTPVLLPGKSHGRRSLVGCRPWGPEESDTTERLHFHFSLLCTGEGNGNPLQCSCLENPRDRSHRGGHD